MSSTLVRFSLSPALRARRGIALPLALFALVIIAGLVTAAYYTALLENRAGRNSLTQTRSLTSSEHGIGTMYANWDMSWNNLANGTTVVRAYAPGDGSIDTVRLTKLSQNTFLAVSEGRSGSGLQNGARRRTSMLVRLKIAQPTTPAAITSRGAVRIGGSAALNGRDTSFTGWGCPAAGTAVAGVAVDSIGDLSYSGTCAGGVCLQGSPLYAVTPVAADTNTYFKYGEVNWNDLVAQASKSVTGTMTGIAPVYSGTTCVTSDNRNWGDPGRAAPAKSCESYFPIVYAPGDLNINGNVGQGILIVNGNLNIQGNFTYYGQVIVRGAMKMTGIGNHVYGAVLAATVIDSTATTMVSGNSSIQYSRCALNSAFRANAPPARVRQRSWAELF